MKTNKKFANVREGYGIIGMKLDLSLSQCQALNYHYQEFEKLKDCEDPQTLRAVMSTLIPFLELFKDIQNPMDPDLWVND